MSSVALDSSVQQELHAWARSPDPAGPRSGAAAAAAPTDPAGSTAAAFLRSFEKEAPAQQPEGSSAASFLKSMDKPAVAAATARASPAPSRASSRGSSAAASFKARPPSRSPGTTASTSKRDSFLQHEKRPPADAGGGAAASGGGAAASFLGELGSDEVDIVQAAVLLAEPGGRLGLTLDRDGTSILSVASHGPSEAAGLRPGDQALRLRPAPPQAPRPRHTQARAPTTSTDLRPISSRYSASTASPWGGAATRPGAPLSRRARSARGASSPCGGAAPAAARAVAAPPAPPPPARRRRSARARRG